jgi:hypothetical protein
VSEVVGLETILDFDRYAPYYENGTNNGNADQDRCQSKGIKKRA